MLSGVALSPSLMQKPNQANVLYNLGISFHTELVLLTTFNLLFLFPPADQMNYSVSNEHELIDFLNEIDAQLLLKKSFEPMLVPANGTKEVSHGWTLVVEGIK